MELGSIVVRDTEDIKDLYDGYRYMDMISQRQVVYLTSEGEDLANDIKKTALAVSRTINADLVVYNSFLNEELCFEAHVTYYKFKESLMDMVNKFE